MNLQLKRLALFAAVGGTAGVIGTVNQFVLAEGTLQALQFAAPNWCYWGVLAPYIMQGDLVLLACLAGFIAYATTWMALFGFRRVQLMNMFRAYLILLVSGLAGAALGGLIGLGLGYAAPEYYRGVFRAHGIPSFDPIQVGLGLGVSQGLPIGLLAGAVALVVVTWYQVRREQRLGPPAIDGE